MKSKSEYAREYYLKNKDRILERVKKRALSLREEKKIYDQSYYKINKTKKDAQTLSWAKNNNTKSKEIKRNSYRRTKAQKFAYIRNRYKNDIQFRLRAILRSRVSYLKRSGSHIKDLGCSVSFLKSYLEQKFKPGMTWENWGRLGWHIDHIRPLASFDLTYRDQFLQACHYTNLQPLWASENIAKGGKVG